MVADVIIACTSIILYEGSKAIIHYLTLKKSSRLIVIEKALAGTT